MKTALRITTFCALACAAMLLVLGEETEQTTGAFLLHFVFNKSLGIALFYLACRLFGRWAKTDKFFRQFAQYDI